jgi:hypothetical protein
MVGLVGAMEKVGLIEGVREGDLLGVRDLVGRSDGEALGETDGRNVGVNDGIALGI